MEQYVIRGGNPLVGEVEIGGAKNAALAILTAATMTDETVLIENLPDVSDINVLLEAIAEIGATVDRIDRHTVRINAATIGDLSVDYEYIKKIPCVLLSFRSRCLENTKERKFRFRADVTLEAVRSTSI